MSDNWNTYFSSIDNKPASFLLDLEPCNNGEDESLVQLFRLSITLKEPNEDGLTSNQEATVLYRMEDSINDSLDNNYMFVGRITTDGRRDFYYYTDSLDGRQLKDLAEKCIDHHMYSIDRIDERSPWSFYHETLYPDQSEWHQMANRQLVDKLRELGDSLEEARIVNHWISFNSEESRNLFLEMVQKDGFHMENQDSELSRYSLIISRKDSVQLHQINDVTDYLVKTSQDFGGEYEGWESKVVKEQGGFLDRLKKIFNS